MWVELPVTDYGWETMQTHERYRCDGCGRVYRVTGEKVLCSECNQVATPHGDPLATREYRLGHAKYVEGRRRTTEAMRRFEAGHMTLARGGFNDAATEFETSVDHFTMATRGAESDAVAETAGRARKKSTCLWQAVEWLSGATYANEQGDMSRATRYREDAQQRLQAASDYGELTDPDTLSD